MFFYSNRNGAMVREEWVSGAPIPNDVIWIDLFSPTREEEKLVEAFLGMGIPTHEEMVEIELSSRLYQEHGAQFMTATMLSKVDTGAPETHAVTFILVGARLITIRYVETTSFRRFSNVLLKLHDGQDGAALFLLLIDTIINRVADILERLDREIDGITKLIFRRDAAAKAESDLDYQNILEKIGRCGDLASKIHESLITFGRVAGYASHNKKLAHGDDEVELNSIRKDILGLSEHGTYLTGKVNFLLDATLGMISIQQNNVFKILSVASLIFMPPTLIAGVYGMNFKLMPELEWHWGYPMAVIIMVVSAILPLAYLRQTRRM